MMAWCLMDNYFAFLLRIWLGDRSGRSEWRAALEDPHTRRVLTFSSIENLCDYLHALALSQPFEKPSQTDGDVEYPLQDLPRQE